MQNSEFFFSDRLGFVVVSVHPSKNTKGRGKKRMQGWVNKVVDRGSPHATADNHVTIAGTRSESFRTTLKL